MLERGHVGLRYIDDFEFGCDTSSNAEQVLSDLVDSAGEFGLVLNPDKTRVVTEKIPHEEPWVGSLRRFKARREKVNNPYDRIAVRNDYMAYFSAAIDFARKNPHDSVARYAVARVAKFPTDHILWPNLQAFLLEMALEDAGALYRVLATLLRFERRGFGPDRPLLEAVLNKGHCPRVSEKARKRGELGLVWCGAVRRTRLEDSCSGRRQLRGSTGRRLAIRSNRSGGGRNAWRPKSTRAALHGGLAEVRVLDACIRSRCARLADRRGRDRNC